MKQLNFRNGKQIIDYQRIEQNVGTEVDIVLNRITQGIIIGMGMFSILTSDEYMDLNMSWNCIKVNTHTYILQMQIKLEKYEQIGCIIHASI